MNLEPNVEEAFSMLVMKAKTVASACAGVTLANKICGGRKANAMAMVSVTVLVRITNHKSGMPSDTFHRSTNIIVNIDPKAPIRIEIIVNVLVSYSVKQAL
jgi:hypothetical protein